MALFDDLPTLSEIESTILAVYQSIRPNASASRGTDLWLNTKIWSRLTFRMHRTVSRALDALFPGTTYGYYLDAWLSLMGLPDGLGGYGRIKARGSGPDADALTVTATGATADLDGEQLTATNGTTYEIDESHAFAGAGTYDYQLVAVSTGSSTNLDVGDTLTFISPPANVQSTATIAIALTNGHDRETDPEGRARLATRWRRPVLPGNVAHWVSVIEEVNPGAAKAYVWPGRENQPYGYGTTDYCATVLGESGDDRIMSTSTMAEIAAAIEDEMPGLLYYNSRQLTCVADPQDIEITFEVGTAATDDQKVDWDAESIKTTVFSWASGTTIVNAVANVCAPTVANGLEVGHRVVINGYEGTVTEVNVTADASQFKVADYPTEWGVGVDNITGCYVCAGGGFVGHIPSSQDDDSTGIMGALQDLADAIGPCKGGHAADSEIDGWEDSWRVTAIVSAAAIVGGGVITSVTADDIAGGGAVDYSPTDTTGTTVNLLCLDQPIVWQVWS